MHYHIISNLTSGSKVNKKLVIKICNFFKKWNKKYTCHYTTHPGHAKTITNDITKHSKQMQTIVCVGGDGTLHEIVNGIYNFKLVNILVIPVGSGNDFARELKVTDCKLEVLLYKTVIKKPKILVADLMRLNDKILSINSIGLGIQESVVHSAEKGFLFTKKQRYLLYTLLHSFRLKHRWYEISYDKNPPIRVKSTMFSCGNGKYGGSGIVLNPHAQCNDTYLSFSIVTKMNWFRMFFNLFKFTKAQNSRIRNEKMFFAKEIKIKTNEKYIECDGTLIATDAKKNQTIDLSIKVVPNVLSILLPA